MENGIEIFAAIGSDGTREVVWGIGSTEVAAEADALLNANRAAPNEPELCDPELTRTVRITAEIEARIKRGFIGAAELGI